MQGLPWLMFARRMRDQRESGWRRVGVFDRGEDLIGTNEILKTWEPFRGQIIVTPRWHVAPLAVLNRDGQQFAELAIKHFLFRVNRCLN